MRQDDVLYEEPLAHYRTSACQLITALGVLTLVIVFASFALLLTTPFVPEDYFIVPSVTVAIAVVWLYALTGQRLRIFADAIEPAFRPVRKILTRAPFTVHRRDIVEVSITPNLAVPAFAKVRVHLKSGARLNLNSRFVSFEASRHLQEFALRIKSDLEGGRSPPPRRIVSPFGRDD